MTMFNKGPQEFLRGVRQHTSQVRFIDDFIHSSLVIPAAGSAESGMAWVKKIVGAAPPTVAGVASAAGGIVALTLTADSQKQTATLYHNDQRTINVLKPGIFEARLTVPVLPTSGTGLYAGLFGDWADGPQAVTYGIFIELISSGEIWCNMDDNATDRRATSGITVIAADVIYMRIDFTDISSVKFFIAINPSSGRRVNWNRVASGTTFAYAATGANAILQPYFEAYKASGTSVGTMHVDYVDIAHDR